MWWAAQFCPWSRAKGKREAGPQEETYSCQTGETNVWKTHLCCLIMESLTCCDFETGRKSFKAWLIWYALFNILWSNFVLVLSPTSRSCILVQLNWFPVSVWRLPAHSSILELLDVFISQLVDFAHVTSRLTLPVSDSAKEEYCFGAPWYIVMTYDFIFPGLLGTVSVACNFRFWRFRASALIEEVFAARTGSRPIAGCRSLADE